MSMDQTSLAPVLKVHYGPQTLKKLSYEGRPLLALLDKYTKFGGETLPLPVQFSKPHNQANNYLAAGRKNSGDPATSTTGYAKFQLTRIQKYGLARLDREAMLAAEGDINSFVRGATNEINNAIDTFSDEVHINLFRSGSGARGSIGSVSADEVTLSNVEDVSMFEPGMALVVATGELVALKNSGEPLTVTHVNRSTGVLTMSEDVAGGGSTLTTDWAANDVIFQYGDRAAGIITSASFTGIAGLDSWLPATAPTSGDSFFGVDRSVDTDRLAGIRVGYITSRRKTLMRAATETGRQGARGARLCLVNPTDMEALMFEYEDKVSHDTVKAPDLEIGFNSISVLSPFGKIQVVADHQCPVGTGYLLDPSTWKLYSIRDMPHIVDESGKFWRPGTSDSFDVEFAGYGNLGCSAPGKNARISWS